MFGTNHGGEVDDCWSDVTGRDASGHLVPNATRFPDGIDGLASKIHNMSLHMGIYSSECTMITMNSRASLADPDLHSGWYSHMWWISRKLGI